jgi:hypothetical protein
MLDIVDEYNILRENCCVLINGDITLIKYIIPIIIEQLHDLIEKLGSIEPFY